MPRLHIASWTRATGGLLRRKGLQSIPRSRVLGHRRERRPAPHVSALLEPCEYLSLSCVARPCTPAVRTDRAKRARAPVQRTPLTISAADCAERACLR